MKDGTFGIKEKPLERKKKINEFKAIDEAEEYSDDEIEVARFKKPISGRSSRSYKGGKTDEGGLRSNEKIDRKGITEKTFENNLDSPDEEYLLDDSTLMLD